MAGMLPSSFKITPESVMAKMNLTEQQKPQLERIVAAGQKVMFAEETQSMIDEAMSGPGTLAEKIGQSVAGLMFLLMEESRNSLPPNLIIPAGLILVVHAAKFASDAGEKVTDQDIGQASEVMVDTIMRAVKLDPDKVEAAMQQASKKG